MNFQIEPTQEKKFQEFYAKHDGGCYHGHGAIGVSPVEVVFTQTSVAMHVKARCTRCKDEIDLNDYDTW